jgi:hypothetical protein
VLDAETHAGSRCLLLPGLARAPLVVALALVALAPAEAGHELPFYPSFYPQEIKVETVAPAAAAARLQESSLHAYVGADPFVAGAPPKDVAAVESFGSYVVVDVDPATVPDRAERCAIADEVRNRLGRVKSDFVFHPYPVTPYHADYLGHFDRVSAPRTAIAARGRDASRPDVSLGARGPIAAKLVAELWDHPRATEPRATIAQIDLETLVDAARIETNGWLGPPWLEQGWYQAYLLDAPVVSDAAAKRTIEATYRRLVTGAYDSLKGRIDLERTLVSALTSGCERSVAGYTLKREYTSAEYSQGVENVAWDAQAGLGSAIFVRTVKLKDFPWNGWLRVGTPTSPAAAWNPIGGFSDPAGRLIWAALGDPAFIPAPRGAGWLPNRTSADVIATGGVAVPADAVRATPGTGVLTPIGPGTRARTKLIYRVRESAFHDGTRMSVPDILYALSFALRWGGGAADGSNHDAGLAAATALLRERLVALRVTKVETIVKKYSDVEFVYDVPIVEVYIDRAGGDAPELAAIAPPWSAVPWHVLALMEEAARRRLGAFSREEASRRGVPWLDLVRDGRTRDALAALVDTWQVQGYVPPALRKFVTPAQARPRWAALKRFHQGSGHFLVTNGPYRLDKWSEETAVLTVFRDLTYPIGVGNFDDYAIPVRAYVRTITDRGDRLEIRAEVERVSKFARSYEIVREPLGPEQPGLHEHVPACRYVVVNGDGAVVRAGRASSDAQRVFIVDLKGLPPGAYKVATAFEAAGNSVEAPITVSEHHVAAR